MLAMRSGLAHLDFGRRCGLAHARHGLAALGAETRWLGDGAGVFMSPPCRRECLLPSRILVSRRSLVAAHLVLR